MDLWKRKQKTRADTHFTAMWLSSDDEIPIGYTKLADNEEVRKCINKLAGLVSSMTIMVMENGEKGDIRIKNGLSRALDVAPSRMMIRKNFIHKIVVDMMIHGNCVVYPEIDQDGNPKNHTILRTSEVSFQERGDSYVIRYRGQELSPDEVLHFVLVPDDNRPFRGVGYVNQIRMTVENLVQAQKTKRAFLKSKWKPPLIISIEADEEYLQDKEKRTRLLSSYRDETEAGEPWLIPAGQIDVKEIKPLTLNDLAIQDSITLDKSAVASAFNMPPFMVGVGEFKKDAYNNLIATEVMSLAMILQQEFTKKEVWKENQYVKFNPKSLMQYDIGELTTHVKEMVGGGLMNRNEGRNMFDYSPVDADGMDEFIVLENYIPVSRVEDQKKLKGGNSGEV